MTAPTQQVARRQAPRLVLLLVVVVALVVRWPFVGFESGDYTAFIDPWYQRLAGQGFSALGESFANYDSPYLVLLWLVTKLPLPELVGIKLISVLFDLVLGGFVHRIVRQLRPGSTWWPVAVTSVVLLLPTVAMNGAVWGQCDSVYAALGCGSLDLLLRRKPWGAAALLGAAFAFKLQALFLLPLLVLTVLGTGHRLRSLLGLPASYLGLLLPAWLAGRSWLSQLAVYPSQVTDPAGIGGPELTHGAPTPYAWLPADASDAWTYLGLALTALAVAGSGGWLLRQRRPLRDADVVLLAAVSVLVIPLLLPGMHERYFYLAEVLLVVAVAVDRRFILPALVLQAASCTTYLAFLTGRTVLPLPVTAAVVLAVGVAAVLLLRRHVGTGAGSVQRPGWRLTASPVRRRHRFPGQA